MSLMTKRDVLVLTIGGAILLGSIVFGVLSYVRTSCSVYYDYAAEANLPKGWTQTQASIDKLHVWAMKLPAGCSRAAYLSLISMGQQGLDERPDYDRVNASMPKPVEGAP